MTDVKPLLSLDGLMNPFVTPLHRRQAGHLTQWMKPNNWIAQCRELSTVPPVQARENPLKDAAALAGSEIIAGGRSSRELTARIASKWLAEGDRLRVHLVGLAALGRITAGGHHEALGHLDVAGLTTDTVGGESVRQPPLPFEQLRPHPQGDPGFRLNPDGTARFQYDGHLVDVLVRYTTKEDRAPYTATAEGEEVIVFASVDVGGVTVGRSWMLAEWRNPYSLRESLLYVLREAVDLTERKVDEMAAEVARIRTKRPEATERATMPASLT